MAGVRWPSGTGLQEMTAESSTRRLGASSKSVAWPRCSLVGKRSKRGAGQPWTYRAPGTPTADLARRGARVTRGSPPSGGRYGRRDPRSVLEAPGAKLGRASRHRPIAARLSRCVDVAPWHPTDDRDRFASAGSPGLPPRVDIPSATQPPFTGRCLFAAALRFHCCEPTSVREAGHAE